MEGDFAFCSCGGYGFVGGGGRDGDLWGRDINFGGCGGFDWGNGDIGGVALRVESWAVKTFDCPTGAIWQD